MTPFSSSRNQGFDVLGLPLIGPFLRWRHARTILQIPLLVLAGLMLLDGLVGPQLAPKNLATVLAWVHYRGLVVLALLLAGNLFCLTCPFMLVRNLFRRIGAVLGMFPVQGPTRPWPRALRNKWLAAGLFGSLLFGYELFDLWANPRGTAWLIGGYFAAAVIIDSLFRGAAFCKYLCPLGQFNMIAATISPLEIQIREQAVCDGCLTKDCIKGRPATKHRGCELWLYQPRKIGNIDCTFCLDCVHACPHDNIGLLPRLPASELVQSEWRSGIGRLTGRPDLAALVAVFCFGAVVNAFAMISPVYELENWLASQLQTNSEFIVLGLIFLGGLVLLPSLLLWLAGRASLQAWGSDRPSLRRVITRYTFSLVPLSFGLWLAHYSFHFLSGFWTFVPVIQSFVQDVAGTAVLGSPRWYLGPLVPMAWLYPLELGFLGLGWMGSLLVVYQLAEQDKPGHAWRVFVPWVVLLSLLLVASVWLMGQPMEMRGTFLAG